MTLSLPSARAAEHAAKDMSTIPLKPATVVLLGQRFAPELLAQPYIFLAASPLTPRARTAISRSVARLIATPILKVTGS